MQAFTRILALRRATDTVNLLTEVHLASSTRRENPRNVLFIVHTVGHPSRVGDYSLIELNMIQGICSGPVFAVTSHASLCRHRPEESLYACIYTVPAIVFEARRQHESGDCNPLSPGLIVDVSEANSSVSFLPLIHYTISGPGPGSYPYESESRACICRHTFAKSRHLGP